MDRSHFATTPYLPIAIVALSAAIVYGLAGPQVASSAAARHPKREGRCTKTAHLHRSVAARRTDARPTTRRPCQTNRTAPAGSTSQPIRPSRSQVPPAGADSELPPNISETPSIESEATGNTTEFSENGSALPPDPEAPDEVATPMAEAEAHFHFFSPTSFWNSRLAANAPLDPHSAEIVRAFDAEISRQQESKVGPWINSITYSVPIYTVPANQPTVKVELTAASAAPSTISVERGSSAAKFPAVSRHRWSARSLAAKHGSSLGVLETSTWHRRLACVLGWCHATRFVQSRRIWPGCLAGSNALVGVVGILHVDRGRAHHV